MSRDRTRTRDRSGASATDVDAMEFEVGETEAARPTERTDDDGLRSRVGSRAERLFSPRAFLAALLLSTVGLLVANTFVPLPGSGLLGVFLATFVFGLLFEESRYAEAAVAGGTVAGASVLLGLVLVAFLGGFGVPLAALGAAAGAAVGVVGNYFGRDLRRGLTREI